ncbi:MAG: PIN domain-containing protein [Staphylothermus sp.]|nr:PIN domain-containing protein [Staphylothermus sp.]
MIIDTTYLLPLARIGIRTDLLRAIVEKRTNIDLELTDLKISLISVFELQAKATKLGISPENISEAINVVLNVFDTIPFYRPDIINTAYSLYRNYLNDYIDCIILATAIVLKEPLITEDKRILSKKKRVKEHYDIEIYSYDDLIKQ